MLFPIYELKSGSIRKLDISAVVVSSVEILKLAAVNRVVFSFWYQGEINLKAGVSRQGYSFQWVAEKLFSSKNGISQGTFEFDISDFESGNIEVTAFAITDAQIWRYAEFPEQKAVDRSKVLYDFLFPSYELCCEEPLYCRFSGPNPYYSFEDKRIHLFENCSADLLTYFNGFSSGKWLHHTNVRNVSAFIDISGFAEIILKAQYQDTAIVVKRFIVLSKERSTYAISLDKTALTPLFQTGNDTGSEAGNSDDDLVAQKTDAERMPDDGSRTGYGNALDNCILGIEVRTLSRKQLESLPEYAEIFKTRSNTETASTSTSTSASASGLGSGSEPKKSILGANGRSSQSATVWQKKVICGQDSEASTVRTSSACSDGFVYNFNSESLKNASLFGAGSSGSIFYPQSDSVSDLYSKYRLGSYSLSYSFSCSGLEDIPYPETVIYGGGWLTEDEPTRDVRLGIAITTFRREKEVKAAVARLARDIAGHNLYRDMIDIAVVDNGGTLSREDVKGALLIKNRNLGGTGGFTRGLIHYQESGKHTHCLFMDDDASCEAGAIFRSMSFMRHAVNPKVSLSGAMLFENIKFMQWENGAWFDGGCHSLKRDFDLRDPKMLWENEEETDRPVYGAWWFFFFPLAEAKRYSLPFFVRGDDIDFSYANDFKVASLNGVSCWQQDFKTKESAMTAYLFLRSHVIHHLTIPTLKCSFRIIWKILWGHFRAYNDSYFYGAASCVNLAMSHVLKGPKFFEDNMEPTEILKRIKELSQCEKYVPYSQEELSSLELAQENIKTKLLPAFVRTASLNGHLLPGFMIRKTPKAMLYKWMTPNKNRMHMRSQVTVVDLLNRKKAVLKRSPARYLKNLVSFMFLALRLRLSLGSLSKRYRKAEEKQRSREFWKNSFAETETETETVTVIKTKSETETETETKTETTETETKKSVSYDTTISNANEGAVSNETASASQSGVARDDNKNNSAIGEQS